MKRNSLYCHVLRGRLGLGSAGLAASGMRTGVGYRMQPISFRNHSGLLCTAPSARRGCLPGVRPTASHLCAKSPGFSPSLTLPSRSPQKHTRINPNTFPAAESALAPNPLLPRGPQPEEAPKPAFSRSPQRAESTWLCHP